MKLNRLIKMMMTINQEVRIRTKRIMSLALVNQEVLLFKECKLNPNVKLLSKLSKRKI